MMPALPTSVTSVTLLANDPAQTFTFVFDPPIPINMTDFYLHQKFEESVNLRSFA